MKASVIEITSAKKNVPELLQAQFIGFSILFILFLGTFAFLIYSGFTITVAQGKNFKALSESNSVGKEVTFGERGMIVDAGGRALVINKKAYDIFVDPTEITQSAAEKLFPEKKERISDVYKNNVLVPVLIVHDASKELVVSLKEQHPNGVELRPSYVRQYVNSFPFAGLLGYTGVVSESDLENNSNYVQNQIVGKDGLEYQYDSILQGQLQYNTYEKDALGNKISSENIAEPLAGSTIQLSIDKKTQEHFYSAIKKAVDEHKAKGGSGVIINVTNGEVLALTSYPSYDTNAFVTGISQKDYNKLALSPQTPLLFRPIAAQEPPGSTFKTIVATAALETKTISKDTVFVATGVIRLSGGQPFQDYHKHYYGALTVRDALMVSSNIFFCKTIIKLGIDKLLPYASAYGIGEKTGIDLPGEMPGRLPSPENKIALAKAGATWLDPVWYPEGDSCNSAIGQGIGLATPLQMATVAAAIANGGTVYKPHVVQKIISSDGKTQTKNATVTAKDIASDSTLQTIREGMRMSVNGPRAIITSLKYVPVKVAAKTGTAEFGVKDKNGYSTAHAWVIGFYPYDHPQYAFAILIEGGGTSSVASFAMRDFLNSMK